MKLRLLFFWYIMLIVPLAHAQEYFNSLYQFTPLIYHPASVATDYEASVSFLNRKTTIAPGVSYQNNIFNAEYPLVDQKKGKRYGGIGIHFQQKDAGTADVLQSTNLGLSLAYNLPVSKDQYVSFGIQSNYNNQKTSMSSLTTGSQWLASEFRFDPSASLGEVIAENRINYFSLHTSAMWYLIDRTTQDQKAFVGVAAYNLNKPNASFFENQSKVPVSYLVHVGALVYQHGPYHLSPQLVYLYNNFQHKVNLLLSNRIYFNNENPYDIIKSGSIEVLAKYDFKRDLGLGLTFHQPGISFGFNYNTPLASNTDRYFTSAFEFGILLSRIVWKPKPTKVNLTQASTKRNFDFNTSPNNRNSQTQPAQVEAKAETDIIQKNIEQYSKVNAVQFELDKNFKFAFGRTELDTDAKQFLDELYSLMQKNPEYSLEVIGHTDNVGKPIVNYKLSAGRAQAVADYLIQKGLSKERIKSRGMGDTQPIAENDSDESRARNRRVQFIIYINR